MAIVAGIVWHYTIIMRIQFNVIIPKLIGIVNENPNVTHIQLPNTPRTNLNRSNGDSGVGGKKPARTAPDRLSSTRALIGRQVKPRPPPPANRRAPPAVDKQSALIDS